MKKGRDNEAEEISLTRRCLHKALKPIYPIGCSDTNNTVKVDNAKTESKQRSFKDMHPTRQASTTQAMK